MKTEDLKSISISLASPEDILSWSHGEVTKPETINYRTQRAEKDGLFCEKIFGPERDFQCYCGKYKGVRYKGVICDRCGVEVTRSQVRRERMGHIKLACPVSHIWFLRGVPSRMGLVLDLPGQQLEKVIYFAAYIVTRVDEIAKKQLKEEINKEYNEKIKKLENQNEGKKKQELLRKARDQALEELNSLKPLRILSEIEYHNFSLKYGHIFEAGTGAETLKAIFEKIDLTETIKKLEAKLTSVTTPALKRKLFVRLKLFKSLARGSMRPEWMFLEVLPVIPPDLRPMVQLDGGRFASSDLNDLYRRVINRNNRLKYLIEIAAPEVIIRNEKRMLQEAVDALIDNTMRKGITTRATTGGRRLLKSLADMLKGKQGRFRQNLLGKRVDYSGRSVIVVGPELQLHQTGLPKKMALELFRPFVIKRILDKGLAYNLRGASRLIEDGTEEVWAILEEVVRDKYVLLNRAPTLHRLGIQAFQPVLIEEECIRIHPMICKAFNADFDGDQMAVHLPLSQKAQDEVKERMLSTKNFLKPATGLPVTVPTQEIVLGCYWLTRIAQKPQKIKIFSSFAEAILAWETGELGLRTLIKVKTEQKGEGQKFLETTVGRILFNEVLPPDYPFQNEEQSNKRLEKLVSDVLERYDSETIARFLDSIKKLGFEYATKSGISWGIDELIIPPNKKEILQRAEEEIGRIEKQESTGLLSKEELRTRIIEIWQKAKFEMEKVVPKHLPSDGSVYAMIESGSRGNWIQVTQMAGMKGLVINPLGQIIELPVKSSYKEGLSVLEYFISTHGARKGTVDTALRTSTAGYLTRRLIDVSHEVIVNAKDCGDKKGFLFRLKDAKDIGQNPAFMLVGRVAAQDISLPENRLKGKRKQGKILVKRGEIIDWKTVQLLEDAGIDEVWLHSPLSCKLKRGICQKCYGWDLGRNKLVELGEAVGIIAAQSIGEPGTQLTMRTFHTGGVAGGGDITSGLPRVEEIFEARIPGGKAVIAQASGVVYDITKDRIVRIKNTNKKEITKKNSEYRIPIDQAILVQKGDNVSKGQPLSEGSLDLQELLRLTNIEEVQRYIVREVQKIYTSQGASIHNKHIEIIVRQMFSRIRIKDPGDSSFVPGEVAEISEFTQVNEQLTRAGKKPATGKQLLLGISRVALSTSSFLSAASFQETSRVLIKAAVENREDHLRGLKENVIIGRLIPAGTGFKKIENRK